ncbi:3-phosphoshikimate 1-carboxyvinyltransferase [Candidatus Peregrinibacteria bacterium]|nr:3-phosphoshikimate 1-carboxyvinyltransferase [Candidatus Peregrinibacteria bacterium]
MQKARITPGRITPKTITIPGSKSFTNRALIIASLAQGTSLLRTPLYSDDTKAMMHALKQLGVTIHRNEKNHLVVNGTGGVFHKPNAPLYVGNAGTAMRFLTALASLHTGKIKLTGDNRMQQRPIKDLVKALRTMGVKIRTVKKNGCPPLTIKGGALRGGDVTLSGTMSSQYVSALLMVCPYARQDTTITIEDELTSKPYIDMTLEIMEAFGVKVKNDHYKTFHVASQQQYQPQEYNIEGDASSASYFHALEVLHNVHIPLDNTNKNSSQPDEGITDIIETMKPSKSEAHLAPLGEIDLNHMPDAAMTVAVLCSFAQGESRLKNIGNMRYKETNRLKALCKELGKIGVDIRETEDGLHINGNPDRLHGNALIETYNDHRIAMCMALCATKLPDIHILDPACTSKTYPRFFDDLAKLGVTIERTDIPNIYLIGMRGSGKSSIGKKLAQKLKYRFADTDHEIEKQEKLSIPDIIKRNNWFYFRKKEKYIIRKYTKKKHVVLATGGGVILDKDNRKKLHNNGKIVFLSCEINTLEKRIKKSHYRPPLTKKQSLHEELHHVWKKRKDLYESSADLIIKNDKHLSLEETAEKIIMEL